MKNWWQVKNGELSFKLRPQTIDALVNPSFWAQRIRSHHFEISTKLSFSTENENESAGIVLYRKSSMHYQLLKQKNQIVLIKTVAKEIKGTDSNKEVVASIPYTKEEVVFALKGEGLDLQFY